jgi:hypothetical protein
MFDLRLARLVFTSRSMLRMRNKETVGDENPRSTPGARSDHIATSAAAAKETP